MARCTRKCSVAGAASSDVTVHCSPRGTQHHGSWPLRGATTFLRLLYEPFLTRFILSFFSPPPPPPPRLLFPLFLLSALCFRAGEGQRGETRCAHAMWIVRERRNFWEGIAWDFVSRTRLELTLYIIWEEIFLNTKNRSNISFSNVFNFGKFAGKIESIYYRICFEG